MKCEHKYKVLSFSAEPYLFEIRKAFGDNNPFLAALRVEEYYQRRSVQQEVDNGINFALSGKCQACDPIDE